MGIPILIGNHNDRSSLEEAFKGVSRLPFVVSEGDGCDVLRQHANMIGVAASSGIEPIAFTSITDVDGTSSFSFAPVYRDAERRLVECGVEWTILRCSLDSDFVLANWLRPARSTGEVSVPLGSARIAPVSRDDVADAAASVLASPDGCDKV